MRHMVANLDIYRNTRLAKAEYARRSEGKGAGWMGLGVTTSQASDGSESWTAKGSSLGTVRSGLQDLLDVAIKTGSDDHQEGNITGKDPGGLSQVDDHDSDGVLDPSDKFPHITWLKKELGLYEREKPSMMEEEVLISYVNPFLYGNEIGHGCFLLKPPQPMEEQLRMLIIRSSKTMDRFKLPASTALVLTGIPRVIIHLGRWVL
ncbi:hypothetical protein SAY86_022805 [Trapa natans]|uniref:Uncharacterized protein n=1 Tax=Trapa natans TaxID=22666 RepID=A0AAN7M9P8_TRANT|nr:hypothetical protein SAY86_022805 [Trapa natans]